MVKVLIKKLNPKVNVPSYKTKGASGMGLMACLEKHIETIKPHIMTFDTAKESLDPILSLK